ncbi:TRAP transporter small permease [Treponema pectinovorum]|uniref:TRAP transporter small permease n=1 Tax=Treponema pectinovorum TaxID=164 RepID=UPI0011CC6D07|nr:TRAP transporter small permease [Treponema pectinovorum]
MKYIALCYKKFTKIEEFLTNLFLIAITALVFLSAVARTLHHPINWAVDFSLLLFAWEVFLGGDIAVRNTKLIGVEILTDKLPVRMQKALSLIFFCLIIAFCLFLTFFGIKLSAENTKRLFQVLPISYSWCTVCVPVGCFFMAISSCIKIHEIIKTPASAWSKKERAVV